MAITFRSVLAGGGGGTVPDGKTVTPINSVETWLNCANIWSSSYTTLADILADSSVLNILVSSNNAVDYMIRSTSFASTLCANQSFLQKVKQDNYCLTNIMSDDTWANAVCDSQYFEIILNKKIPTMTSNNTPSGIASANSVWQSGYEAFRVFDNNNNTSWTADTYENCYVQYQFTEAINVKKVTLKSDKLGDYYGLGVFKLQGSNNGSDWTDITSLITNTHTDAQFNTNIIDNQDSYNYYRLYVTRSSSGNSMKYCGCTTFQVYGL